jgi:hypothetical protein
MLPGGGESRIFPLGRLGSPSRVQFASETSQRHHDQVPKKISIRGSCIVIHRIRMVEQVMGLTKILPKLF